MCSCVLQQMVSLPDTVRKTAAIDEDRSGAEQVVEPSGTGGSEQSKPLTVVKNVAAVGFGIVGTVILLFTLLLCAMELTRTFLLWNAERRRRRMSIEERVRQSQKLIFKLISLWELTRRSAGRPRRLIRRLRTRCRRLSPESTSV